jgi:hypothetical protein
MAYFLNQLRVHIVRDFGQIMHLYFYVIDRELGFMHIRLQTWFPFQIQIYLNGHEWLARQLERRGIEFERYENTFLSIERETERSRISRPAVAPFVIGAQAIDLRTATDFGLPSTTDADLPVHPSARPGAQAEDRTGYAETSRNNGLFAARRSNVHVTSAPSLRPDSPIT